MDYKKLSSVFTASFGRIGNFLFALGFMAGYVLLRIYVAPHMPFFENYHDAILVPYGTIVFAGWSYYLTRSISNTLQVCGIAIVTLTPIVMLYDMFPQYRQIISIAIMVAVWINIIYRRYYTK